MSQPRDSHLVTEVADRARRGLDRVGAWWKLREARPTPLDRLGPAPDFLGIGAQKAGTTWLDQNLRCHPELFLPAAKELHFFDQRLYRGYASYLDWFRDGASRVKGEITPAYGVLPEERIALVRRLLPEVKLILILRDPIERSWSHALMDVAFRRGRAPESVSVEEWKQFLSSPACTARSDYLGMLGAWTRHFPESSLHVGFHEGLTARPRDFLRDVFRFLGVRESVEWSRFPLSAEIQPASIRRARGAGKPHMPDEVGRYLAEQQRPSLEALARRFPDVASKWLAACELR